VIAVVVCAAEPADEFADAVGHVPRSVDGARAAPAAAAAAAAAAGCLVNSLEWKLLDNASSGDKDLRTRVACEAATMVAAGAACPAHPSGVQELLPPRQARCQWRIDPCPGVEV